MVDAVETMAWAGQVPWHGLGEKVVDTLTPDQMCKAAGLNWKVEKRPVFTQRPNGEYVPVPDRFGLVRTQDNHVLDLVGKSYVPTQNEQAMSFFKQFVEAGNAKMETAGSLINGQYIWGLAKLEQEFKLGRGSQEDRLMSYVLVMNPHKHGKGLVCKQTTVRVVCWNTLSQSLKAGGRSVSLPHIREFTPEVQKEAAELIGLARDQFKAQMEEIKFLSSKACNGDESTEYFKELLGIKKDEEVTKGKSRTLSKLESALNEGPGAQLSSAEGTWWGAVNAVTFVNDHRLGNDRDKVMRDNWLGYRGQMKVRAFDLAMEKAKAA